MFFSDTKENRALADATISRLKAEARMESTKASLFKVGGYSAFVVCLGLGCGAAFLGYASIKDAQSSSGEISNILVKAISNASITTKGEVDLVPGTLLVLKPDQTLRLDPNASLKVESGGTGRMQDTYPRFDPLTNPAQPKSGGKVATRYTVLKEVKYAKGAVMTAWTFASNESAKPDRQRCYYSERTDQSSVLRVTELAVNGQIVSHAGGSINTEAAVTNCVWFNEFKGA
jgi:hypothetical protein